LGYLRRTGLTAMEPAYTSPYFWASAFVLSVLFSLTILVVAVAIRDARRANERTR